MKRPQTKEKILLSAIDLFSANGFPDTSMRQIADACGIKSPSIYNHFSSKDDILDSIFHMYKSELESNVPTIDIDTLKPPVSAGALLDSLLITLPPEHSEVNEKIIRIINNEQLINEKIQQHRIELVNRYYIRVERSLNAFMSRGLIKPCNTRVITSLLMCVEAAFSLFHLFDRTQIEVCRDDLDGLGLLESILELVVL